MSVRFVRIRGKVVPIHADGSRLKSSERKAVADRHEKKALKLTVAAGVLAGAARTQMKFTKFALPFTVLGRTFRPKVSVLKGITREGIALAVAGGVVGHLAARNVDKANKVRGKREFSQTIKAVAVHTIARNAAEKLTPHILRGGVYGASRAAKTRTVRNVVASFRPRAIRTVTPYAPLLLARVK